MKGIFVRAWFAGSVIWNLIILYSMPYEGSPFRYWEAATVPPLAVLVLGLVVRWIFTGRFPL